MEPIDILPSGAWNERVLDTIAPLHGFDWPLLHKFAEFLQGKSVVDLGCGLGTWVDHLQLHGVYAVGYDGNPFTPQLSGHRCGVIDLTKRFTLTPAFDWVLSLEVGEHIPAQYELVYLDNVCANANEGVILSWADVGTPGTGHVNCQPFEWVKERMWCRHFDLDEEATKELRQHATMPWFQKSVAVYRKAN